jgi:D-glycero-D-manno-heptose 1,7-bisphosphate phosphatase
MKTACEKIAMTTFCVKQNKAVIFDRDGVINYLVNRGDVATSPWSLSELVFKPGIKEAVDILRDLGFLIFVVTNQPGVYDGDMTMADLEEINGAIDSYLNVDDILAALDRNGDDYKPRSGSIKKLIARWNLDPDQSFLIGDRWKDIAAGKAEGLTTILVGNTPYTHDIKPDIITTDAYSASLIIKEIYDDCVRGERDLEEVERRN